MSEQDIAQRFLAVGADLLQQATRQYSEDDPEGAKVTQAILKAGGTARLSVTLSLAGVAWLACEVVEPNGISHTLATLELRRAVRS